MKCVQKKEANSLLYTIGMELGDWNEIRHIAGPCPAKWVTYDAPKDELLNFSHYVAGWLPKGEWKIFQVDNSTGWMDPVQASLFGGLLFGGEHISDINKCGNKTFLFEFGKGKDMDIDVELVISNMIFTFLMFNSHGYVVSSGSGAGQLLGIQDGAIYFLSLQDNEISSARALLGKFEQNRASPPQWIIEAIEYRQEQMLGS